MLYCLTFNFEIIKPVNGNVVKFIEFPRSNKYQHKVIFSVKIHGKCEACWLFSMKMTLKWYPYPNPNNILTKNSELGPLLSVTTMGYFILNSLFF